MFVDFQQVVVVQEWRFMVMYDPLNGVDFHGDADVNRNSVDDLDGRDELHLRAMNHSILESF